MDEKAEHGRSHLAYVEHMLPTRTRLKVPSKRGDAGYFDSVAAGLSKLPGVRSVRVNPGCASFIMKHVPNALVTISSKAAQ